MRTREWRKGVWIGILILVIAWLSYLIYGLSGKAVVAWRAAGQVKMQYEALEVRRAGLEADLDGMRTQRGQEAAIRESFGVAKPGEEVIVVVPVQVATSTTKKHLWESILFWID